MLKGRQDMLWLAGQVLLSRNFVKEAEERGLDAIFAACPYGDLTKQEKAAFSSAFEDKQMREVIEKWWETYDQKRKEMVIATPGEFWE